MSNIKNVIVSSYIGDGAATYFNAAGLTTTNPGYSIVTLNGVKQLFGSDYTLDNNFRVIFNNAPHLNGAIIIYSFETSEGNLSITDKDNVTTVTKTVFITDGSSLSYAIRGPVLTNLDHYIIIAGGYIKQINKDYTISNNILTFNSLPPRGIVVQILSISATLYELSSVTSKDQISLATRTVITADGIKNTYTIEGSTSNKSVYTFVFVNGLIYEGGIDYIVSQNRIKFNRVPTANSLIEVIAFGAPPPPIIPPSMKRVRYLDKSKNLNERTLFRNWWREQIAHYSLTVNYYVNLTNRTNVDAIYGEAPLAGYSEPEELNVALKVENESSGFSKWLLTTDTDSTVIIHHDDFQEIFGEGSEPKMGDLMEFTELGLDRLNYPVRGPKLMEITEKLDESASEINNIAGHYVWVLKLKRFDYSRESSIIPELGTKEGTDTGETVDGIPNQIDELSKKIFNYDQNPCSNDRVYGDY